MNVEQFISARSFSSFSKTFTKSIIYIAIVAVALSLAVILLSQSIFTGFQRSIQDKIFGFWGHIHITDIGVNRSIEPIPMQKNDSLIQAITQYPYSEIKSVRAIEKWDPFVILPGIAQKESLASGLFFKGVDDSFHWDFLKEFIKKGSVIQMRDSGYSRDILLSEQISTQIKADTGMSITVSLVREGQIVKRKLKVCGIYKTGLEEYDSKFAIVDIRLLQTLLGWDKNQITGIELFVSNIAEAEIISDQIYSEILPSQLYSETIRSKYPNIFEWLALQDINKIFILGLVLLVCIINMSTMLLVLILERTYMIGVLTAIGMPFQRQRKIFLYYAGYIIIRGMLIGNLIGLGIAVIQFKTKIFKLSEADYYLSNVPVAMDPLPIILINVAFFIIILLVMLIPSWIVNRIKPVDAIKFS
ncbi:MAG TPA: FtsX-like permease family protein [Saprospiraceae bacterium]|nr:FtsX-like permease family protein [Saprospiraceae bacterium]